MNMSKWRLGFYCFCLVALGLASNVVNNVPKKAKRSLASRAIASVTNVAIDRAAQEEVLVVTPFGVIYKRTRYVESIRMQVKDNRELLSKIKAKDAEIKRKAIELEKLKGQNDVAKSIIALALKDIQDLDQERKGLQSKLVAVQRRHSQEKESLEADITSLKEQLETEQSGKAEETKLKKEALAQLELAKSEFTSLKSELDETSGELVLAEDEIERLEIVVAALSDDLEVKKAKIAEQETKLTEQDTKLTEQETKISEQSESLAQLAEAECKQKKQLEELKKQVETFETEKSEMDEVIAALKTEKEETDKQRVEERKQIEALLARFSMFATLSTQQPQVQMPQVMHNPLTDSSMVDWNQYMMLSMMGNMSRTGAMNPFDFNGGNSEVNSYYYMPKQATDAYLYNSALNPTGTSWGDIGPSNYFGSLGGGFNFGQQNGQMSALQPNRGPAFYQF